MKHFLEGQEAYWNTGEFTTNPYPPGSFEAVEWGDGFNMAFENDNYYGDDE